MGRFPLFVDVQGAKPLFPVNETGQPLDLASEPAPKLVIGNFQQNAEKGSARLNIVQNFEASSIKQMSRSAITCVLLESGVYQAMVARQGQEVLWNGERIEEGGSFLLTSGRLQVRGRVVEVFTVESAQDVDAADSDVKLGLTQSASVSALEASHAVRTRNIARAAEAPWQLWRKIAEIAGQGLPLQEVLNRIGPLIARLVPKIKGLSLMMKDDISRQFVSPAPLPLRSGVAPIPMRTSRTLAEQALITNKALLFTPSSDAVAASMAALAQDQLSLLVAPINEAAVLEAVAAERFTLEDLDQLAAVASQMQTVFLEISARSRLQMSRALEFAAQQAGNSLRRRMLVDMPVVSGVTLAREFQPKFHAGGDVILMSTTNDGAVNVLLADVAGHDVNSGMQAADIHSLANHDRGMSSPGQLLTKLNAAFQDDGELHLQTTACAIRLDPETGELTMANAGHYDPLVFRGSEVHSFGVTARIVDCTPLSPEDRSSLPLGILPYAAYEEVSVELQDGDYLVMFTDGVTEHHSSTLDKDFGLQGVITTVLAALKGTATPPQELIDAIKQALHKHADGANFADDVTIFVMKYDRREAQ